MRLLLILVLMLLTLSLMAHPVRAGDTKAINNLSATKSNRGGKTSVFPDIAESPPEGPASNPVPYPDVAETEETTQGSKDTKVDVKSPETQGEEAVLPRDGILQDTGGDKKKLRRRPR